jgi:ribosomal protein L31E
MVDQFPELLDRLVEVSYLVGMNFDKERRPSSQRAARPFKEVNFIPLHVNLDQVWVKALGLAEIINRRHIDGNAPRGAISERRTVASCLEAHRSEARPHCLSHDTDILDFV